jgi:hypothetical protein
MPTVTSITNQATSAAQSAATNTINSALSKVSAAGSFGALGGLSGFGSLSSLLSQTASSTALGKLSSPVFGGGPSDAVAVVDVYGISNGNVINNTVDKLSGFDTGSLGNFRQSGGLLGSLSSLGKSALGGLSSLGSVLGNSLGGITSGVSLTGMAGGLNSGLGLGALTSGLLSGNGASSVLLNLVPLATSVATGNTNLSSISSRVLGSLGGQGSVLGYSSGLQTSLLGGIATAVGGQFGIPSSVFSMGIALIGGQRTTFYSDNISDASAVAGLANNISGVPDTVQIIDVGAESSTMSTAITQMITLGLPTGVNALVTAASDPIVAKNALTANIQTAVNASDMATIALLISNLGVGTIRAQMPDFAAKLLASYKIASGKTVNDYSALATELVGVLNTVQVNWDSATRNGEIVTNLSAFTGISADATKILTTIPTYALAVALAPTYRSVDLWSTVKSEYPLMVSM